ncbi:hypothetical protein [Corallococcus macrosporus]|uniref:Uncharacterized protein n=1 Tax=Corallococcus macrosporus DSM 14697 TaxID=1189310 RepID=A0A250K2L7_9BACT|nr:hypothetical protein [Corallococcus macrosporus]ATB50243.1 hypothetical protein MYMAC_005898 [Corallococcus macrosporus DSM 14697]
MSKFRFPAVLAASAVMGFPVGCSKHGESAQGGMPPTAQQMPQQDDGVSPGARARMKTDCPMDVSGAQARAEDIPEGVALIIVTSETDKVADLQQRSRRMMQFQQQQGTGGSGMAQPPGVDYDEMGGQEEPGSAGAPSVPSVASVHDSPEGVVIVYTAVDPARQDTLSSEIHRNAKYLDTGKCPGMAAD